MLAHPEGDFAVTQEIRELIDRILSSYDEMDRRFTAAGGLGSLLSLYEQVRRELERVSFQELDRMTGEIKNVIEALLTIDVLEEDYIAKAFRYAREATKADLVLNETFGHTGLIKERVDRFFELVERLKSKGVPIDGVGTEMHLEAPLDPDYLDQFRDFLQRAKKDGVAVYITEMDVYQGPQGAVPNAWDNQKKIYHDVTATCLADSNCKGMTIWDLSDKDTWLANKKRNAIPDAKPDLFDEAHQKKPQNDPSAQPRSS